MTEIARKPNFKRSRQMATALLLRQDLSSLRYDVRTFRFDRDIIIDTIQNYIDLTGSHPSQFQISDRFLPACTIQYGDTYLVLYDDTQLNSERRHWGICHEIAHIYLGHTQDGPTEEIEANFFVAQLLMPEVVLIALRKRLPYLDPPMVRFAFNVSISAANRRFKAFERCQRPSVNYLDILLYNKIRPLVDDAVEMFEPMLAGFLH